MTTQNTVPASSTNTAIKNNKLKVAVVDDVKWIVDDLCEAVKAAGFEPIPIVIYDPIRLSLEQVMEKLNGAEMVLLEHFFGVAEYHGDDIADKLPKEVLIVTTSDSEASAGYCSNFLPCKKELRDQYHFDRAVEIIKKFAALAQEGHK